MIGFVWSVDHYDPKKNLQGKHREDIYEKLVAFRTEYGHCDVPHDEHEDEFQATWDKTRCSMLYH